MNEDVGRVQQAEPGSREPSPEGLGPAGFDPSRWLLHTIAAAIDHPSLYMGGPSRQSVETARRILQSLSNPPREFTRMLQGAVTGYPRAEAVAAIWDAAMRASHSFSDRDRSGEADETARQAQPEARARAEGIAQPPPL